MTYTIDLVDETNTLTEKQLELVTNVVHTAFEMEEQPDESEVSITFVSNERIHELNRDYRNIDRPTDVLSFALNEGEEDIQHEDLPNMLGDIIISIDKTRDQATEYEHSFERELSFLAVHGFLHLLGYLHDTKEDEDKMTARQEEVLEQHGLKK
ncbi:rRNA maturation RNase YbeY [Paenalkalicoccus suaedae]|uniref:Endoribonuclease YbeY n=1 Tax=Paenalkalicoccus suaedae TaxID=2592382 RepID=A0A859FDG3_9BACI|nr:rRNA maturation RNase YbeY [Paenalkalicoccus suaedae]QKS70861.1 rRNA maturation RNase YbeY [Paenalkalicoccus suaedae]